VVDTALNQHINVKVICVEIKELLPIVNFDQFDILAVPEFCQQ
jgi:hypothetical protein